MYPQQKNAYVANQVEGMSPERLILAMYDAALRNLARATDALDRGDVQRKGENLSKTLAIVTELQASLNRDAGELSEQLESLYDYVIRCLTTANVENDKAKVKEASGLIKTVRDGWAQMLEGLGSVPTVPKVPTSEAKRYV